MATSPRPRQWQRGSGRKRQVQSQQRGSYETPLGIDGGNVGGTRVFGAGQCFFMISFAALRGPLLAVEPGGARKNPGRKRGGTREKRHGNLLGASAGSGEDNNVFGAGQRFFMIVAAQNLLETLGNSVSAPSHPVFRRDPVFFHFSQGGGKKMSLSRE